MHKQIRMIGTGPVSGSMMAMAALLFGALAAALPASAQKPRIDSPVVAVTYGLERAQLAGTGCGCFWLQGGSAEVAVPLYRGLSAVANLTGGTASNIQPGVSLSKLDYLAGPRYAYSTARFTGGHSSQIFGEALFGGAHGFNSTFPAGAGVANSATSFALQAGGGLDIAIHGNIGVRLFEVEYVRTSLPNGGSNTQNDLRLAFGLSYHFNKQN